MSSAEIGDQVKGKSRVGRQCRLQLQYQVGDSRECLVDRRMRYWKNVEEMKLRSDAGRAKECDRKQSSSLGPSWSSFGYLGIEAWHCDL